MGKTFNDPIAQLREDILVRYARVGPNGRPSRCAKSAVAGGRAKVIFPTMAAATAAEQELADRTFSVRQDVYPCAYGNHFHLTKRRSS